MTTRWFVAAASALAIAVLGCGTPAASGPTPRDRNLLTHDEIVTSARDGSDLYEAVQSLRPHFFEPPPGVQPAGRPHGTTVYIDARRVGGIEALRSLTAGCCRRGALSRSDAVAERVRIARHGRDAGGQAPPCPSRHYVWGDALRPLIGRRANGPPRSS